MVLLDRVLEFYNIKNRFVVKELLIKYMNLVLEKNQKFNLTAIVDESEFVIKHFADSLSLLEYMDKKDEHIKVIDIGTGLGVPGIPVKIALPFIELVLNDSVLKKCNFLEEAISKIGLSGISVVCKRAEDLGRDISFRERFDYVFARAVSELNVLCELTLPLLKIDGVFLAQKGFDCEDEINSSLHAIDILGGTIEDVKKFTLPESDEKRSVIIIRKLRQTPLNYPRKTKQIVKNPIL